MTTADIDAAIARVEKMQSVGATILSNATQLKQWLQGLNPAPVDQPPPPPPPATTGGLPAHVWSMWQHEWNQPTIGAMPADVLATVNLHVLAIAQTGGSGTGTLSFGPHNGQTDAQLTADIAARKAAGVTVSLGIGGSSDGGITITSNAHADETLTSIASYVTTYGIGGIDVDLEPSGSSWAQDPLVYLCRQLKATYGPDFLIGVTPGLYGSYTAAWISLASALDDSLDYIAPMLYDFPEAGDSRLTGVAVNKCDVLTGGGIDPHKIILGFMPRPAGQAYPNATPNPQLILDAYNAAVAKYPTLRGAFVWESSIEAGRGYDTTRLVGAAIRKTAAT